MSSTNYDVELPITYKPAYKHYIPSYHIAIPYFYFAPTANLGHYEGYISFDDNNETAVEYYHENPGPIVWNDENFPYKQTEIPDTGVFSKVYFRNPHRSSCTFTPSNCHVEAKYNTKASFEVQFNTTGFAANSNASFKCSTVYKNTPEQYTWTSATVYYKKSTDVSYQSVSGTITGSWSDYTISTNISLEDGYTYDIYIKAVSDDNQNARTETAQFTTTDAAAIATCIAPSGTFTSKDVTFVWSHATAYGTPQYAYDLQYSINNGSSWTTVANHEVSPNTTASATITNAGVYLWRVRTYNTNDVVGEWAEATFVNQVPANPPTNLQVTTKGRPTVEWVAVSQSAYQVQFILGDSIVYDSGAVYTSETSHFVNQYFNDERSYIVRVRIYNALGEVSEWIETGYQQPSISNVVFTVDGTNGATITVTPDDAFVKYYVLRNKKPIGLVEGYSFTDKYAVGQTNYSVVGVTSDDQSDIQAVGYRVIYDHATLIAQDGQQFTINKRVNEVYEIQTNNEADINKANFIGDDHPTHYPSNMRLKSFTVMCFDDRDIMESLLGTMVFYADNFGNGGWCMVTAYSKADNFIQNSQGAYANEVNLTLEVTNYDDSIEYPL